MLRIASGEFHGGKWSVEVDAVHSPDGETRELSIDLDDVVAEGMRHCTHLIELANYFSDGAVPIPPDLEDFSFPPLDDYLTQRVGGVELRVKIGITPNFALPDRERDMLQKCIGDCLSDVGITAAKAVKTGVTSARKSGDPDGLGIIGMFLGGDLSPELRDELESLMGGRASGLFGRRSRERVG